jgi:hypothetical protein
MKSKLSRREFLKVSGAVSLSIAFRSTPDFDHPEIIGRVTKRVLSVYSEPTFRASDVCILERDELISIRERVISDEGPLYNPLWYQTCGGYAHSGNIQVVRWQPQNPFYGLPQEGALFQISVPYTRTFAQPNPESTPYYRLYYHSNAWVMKVVEGVDGRMWYSLLDDVLGLRYFARAEHLRKIQASELTPISPDVPHREKHIEISLDQQEIRAFEYNRLVLRTRMSSGIPDPKPRYNGIPTITPTGKFYVNRKMPLRHMGDAILTSDLNAYEIPGVPWVTYFHFTGVAFHGTYWHSDFGRPRSHGCVNMRTEEAQWIYRWTMPVVAPNETIGTGVGTKVIVK